jgi:carboxypeptidase PM20D1
MPPPRTVIGALGRAIDRLEERPMPAALREPVSWLFECVARAMPMPHRLAFSNPGLSAPVLKWVLAREPRTNATIRTTTAVTTTTAGGKNNALASEARAVIDARLLPGDTVAQLVDHVRRVIADPQISITTLTAVEPSPIAALDGPGFRALDRTIRRVFPSALVAPGLVVAGTDSRHYLGLAGGVYRFRPYPIRPADLSRVHGVNERIGVEDYARMIAFYADLLRSAAGADDSPAYAPRP